MCLCVLCILHKFHGWGAHVRRCGPLGQNTSPHFAPQRARKKKLMRAAPQKGKQSGSERQKCNPKCLPLSVRCTKQEDRGKAEGWGLVVRAKCRALPRDRRQPGGVAAEGRRRGSGAGERTGGAICAVAEKGGGGPVRATISWQVHSTVDRRTPPGRHHPHHILTGGNSQLHLSPHFELQIDLSPKQ